MSNPLPPLGARLMLVLPVSPALDRARVDALVGAGDVAAIVLCPEAGAPEGAKESAKEGAKHLAALAAPVQKRDIAVLVADQPSLVAAARLDGAHVSTAEPAALKAALAALKPDGIVGVGGLDNRHDAMVAGESGVDYVLFGPLDPDASDAARTLELVAWWAELFEVPCVGVATSLDEVEALAAAGADFVALSPALTAGPQGPAVVGEAQARLSALPAQQS